MNFLLKLFAKKIGGIMCSSVSDVGAVRKNNEDNFFVNDAKTLFVVADGMGGGEQGEVASAALVNAMKKVPDDGDLETRAAAVRAATESAGDEIKAIALKNGFKHMGTTGLVVLIDNANKSRAVVLHVGDSRLYHLRGGALERLTRDHTIGGELSGRTRGASRAALADRGNPLAHVLTRSIGVGEEAELDEKDFSLRADSRLVLCTDGVHDVISDARLKEILSRDVETDAMAKELRESIENAGAPDNFTFIILKAEGAR